MIRKSRTFATTALIIIGFVSLVFYQNCAPARWTSSDEPFNTNGSSQSKNLVLVNAQDKAYYDELFAQGQCIRPEFRSEIINGLNYTQNYYFDKIVKQPDGSYLSRLEHYLRVNSNPQVIYDIEVALINVMRYARICNDIEVLEKITQMLLPSKNFLTARSDGFLIWKSTTGNEILLDSLQFVYALAYHFHSLALQPQSLRSTAMNQFLSGYKTVIWDNHLNRWILVTKEFSVAGWGCEDKNSYNHFDFTFAHIANDGDNLGKALSYCGAIVDKELFLYGSTSEMLATESIDSSLFSLSTEMRAKYLTYIGNGETLIASRITNDGKGSIIDFGKWVNHPDYAFANNFDVDNPFYTQACQDLFKQCTCTLTSCDPKTQLDKYSCPGSTMVSKFLAPCFQPKETSWDISHARRYIHNFFSLYENRKVLNLKIMNPQFIGNFANHFLANYEIKDNQPVFANFTDGNNGWYRAIYNNQTLQQAVGPYQLSLAGITGGYGLWIMYNTGISKPMSEAYKMVRSPELAQDAIRKYYLPASANSTSTVEFTGVLKLEFYASLINPEFVAQYVENSHLLASDTK